MSGTKLWTAFLVFALAGCGSTSMSSRGSDKTPRAKPTAASESQNADGSESKVQDPQGSQPGDPFALPEAGSLAPFQPGRGKSSQPFTPNTFQVPNDVLNVAHPACANKLAAPAVASNVKPTMDGDLQEWSGKGLVAWDVAGDGPGKIAGTDLLTLQLADDGAWIYVGVRLAARWPVGGEIAWELSVQFVDATFHPEQKIADGGTPAVPLRQFVLRGSEIREMLGEQTANVSADLASFAAGPSAIELRFSRGALKLPATWAVTVSTYDGNSPDSSVHDALHSPIIGIPTDYACAVAMPQSREKIFVMQRQPDVSLDAAEKSYRAIIAAAPEVEYVLEDGYTYGTTISAVVVGGADWWGYWSDYGHLYFIANQSYPFPDDNSFSHFETAAHEFAHGFNVGKYRLPDGLTAEGHSVWSELRAIESYYGPGPAQFSKLFYASDFLDGEALGANGSGVGDAAWPPTGKTISFAYAKGGFFMTGLIQKLGYANVKNVLHTGESGRPAWADSSEFLTAVARIPSFPGQAGTQTWSGWQKDGSYNGALFTPTDVLGSLVNAVDQFRAWRDQDQSSLFLIGRSGRRTDGHSPRR